MRRDRRDVERAPASAADEGPASAADDIEPRWHQALAFALIGRRLPDLGAQPTPDLEALASRLEREHTESATLHKDVRAQGGQGWPHPVPPDLMAGLGFAQFASALRLLQSRLGLDPTPRSVPRVSQARRRPADDRRLLDEVPPHHGS